MNLCEKYAALISAAVDGEVTPDERRELMDHLAQCPDCREIYGQMMAMSQAFDELDAQLPGDLTADVMAKVRAGSAPVKKTAKRGRWWQMGAAVACCALVILGYQQLGGMEDAGDIAYTMNTAAASVSDTVDADTAADDCVVAVTAGDSAVTAKTSAAEEEDLSDEMIMANALTYFRGRPEMEISPVEEEPVPVEEIFSISTITSGDVALAKRMEQISGAVGYSETGTTVWVISVEEAALLEGWLNAEGVPYVLEQMELSAEDSEELAGLVCVVYQAETLPDEEAAQEPAA